MAEAGPSTPLSSRSAPAGSGGRHLKRLSLSTSFSPSSPVANASPLSAATSPSSARGTPGTPADRRGNHGVRSLRLSMSGNLPSPSSFASPPAHNTPDAPGTSGTTPLDGQHAAHERSTSPTLLRRSASYRTAASPASSLPPSGSATPPPLDGARTPRSAHGRRGASISYTGTSSLDGLNGLGLLAGGASGENDGPRRSLNGSAPYADESLGRSRGRMSLSGVQEEGESHDQATHPADDIATLSSAPRASASSSSNAIPAQATLVEQNADLLSFIAKKERKCLDLREELKRHEGELALLKKKWESIVARSLQQQHAQQSHSPNPSSHPRHPSISTVSSASPHTSPSPRPAATLHATHSLDLSLLSSTFDASDGDEGQISPTVEIPESVKAAGTWLSGALGRVLESAVGMPPPTAEDEATASVMPNGLGIVQEEEEEDEQDADRVRRRESKASSVETDTGSLVSGAATQTTAPSSVASEGTVSPEQVAGFQSAAAPASPVIVSPMRPKPSTPRSASPTATRQRLFTPPPVAGSTPPSAGSSISHSRSRSTALDALSGGWTSLGRRLTQIGDSETFRNSKRATLGLVETFEQGLATALGPLEPPPLEPLPPPSPTRRPQRRSSLAAMTGPGGEQQLPRELPSPFLAAQPPTAAAADQQHPAPHKSPSRSPAPLPGPVPGQGLSSVFSTFTKSASLSASAPPSSAHESSRHAPPQQQQQQAGGAWDWSAFLTGSASTEGLAEQAIGGEREKGKGKERETAVEDWPGW
ncbi:uncharacterized protein JCM10292_005189 [Rhodotorula paludigena]|uniref:uncharacterized protein n=1 Tax=Rhodotorula paludigena TaxID=86838 RepID=UPI00316C13D6